MNLCLESVTFPLRLRPETPMTDDELLSFCAINDFLRFERDPNGEIIVMTPAGGQTSRRNAYLTHVLATWAESDGRGYYFDSSGGFTLQDGSMRNPDASWTEATRWNQLSERDKARFAPICPDFIIELRSPSDRLADLEQKMEDWIANGALLAWLIDPQTRRVTIYRRERPPEVLNQPEIVRGEGPVEGFELPTIRLFS